MHHRDASRQGDRSVGQKNVPSHDQYQQGIAAQSLFGIRVSLATRASCLMEERASEMTVYPDMWTNTCCSHPLNDFEEEKIEKDQLGELGRTPRLEHELGIPTSQAPPDNFQYLTHIHYLAPSNGVWGQC
ncbi:hypothetical protein M407DRAFT_228375 [Tulasnella calospora MUT 4182]|uniref:Isopentenyl-diphosphate Delta-isomerase n=1 Tax=Tulasnella calospora MUT 4182 TaxID=1051891 RepID=A0A0C3Q3Y0_9AGAM|nr:hypothetical protein M407DRAFT_228375 [Tulasnella calospora MUT 4182]